MRLSTLRRKAQELREGIAGLSVPDRTTLKVRNLRPDGDYYQVQEELRRLEDALAALQLPPL